MAASTTAVASEPRQVAPLWHTFLFLLAFVGLAASSVFSHGLERIGPSRVPSYLLAMACQWLVVGIVVWGVRLRGLSPGTLIGRKWESLADFVRDLGLAVGFMFLATAITTGAVHLFRATPNDNL